MTDIIMDGKPIEKLEIHLVGEDGNFVWMCGTTKDGKRIETKYLKGTLWASNHPPTARCRSAVNTAPHAF